MIKGDNYATNMNFLVKKNLPVILLKTISTLHPQFKNLDQMDTTPNNISKIDEAITNIFLLLNKLFKYEPKLPIMSVSQFYSYFRGYIIQLQRHWILLNFSSISLSAKLLQLLYRH